MSIISLLIVLIVIGVLVYLVNTYVPMAAPIKTIFNVVITLLVIVWLLHAFGVYSLPLRGLRLR